MFDSWVLREHFQIDVELVAKAPVEEAPPEPTTPRSFAAAELLAVGVAAHPPPPEPTTAEHLAARLAADESFPIELGSRSLCLIPILMPSARSKLNMYAALPPQSSRQSLLAQSMLWQTVRRIYLMVTLWAVLGAAHSTNGVKDIVQDPDALFSTGLRPTFWLASATFMLASAVSTCVNYNKWKFEHTGIRYWCMFAFAYMYMALGQPSSSRTGSGWLIRFRLQELFLQTPCIQVQIWQALTPLRFRGPERAWPSHYYQSGWR